MNEIIFLIEEAPEGGFTARALGESLFTEADDLEELKGNIRDAIRCHFDEGKMPRVASTTSPYPCTIPFEWEPSRT